MLPVTAALAPAKTARSVVRTDRSATISACHNCCNAVTTSSRLLAVAVVAVAVVAVDACCSRRHGGLVGGEETRVPVLISTQYNVRSSKCAKKANPTLSSYNDSL